MTLSAEQEHEIALLREQATPTRRAVVAALEEILYQPLPVLDRGFVRVAIWGDKGTIDQSALVERATTVAPVGGLG